MGIYLYIRNAGRKWSAVHLGLYLLLFYNIINNLEIIFQK